MVFIGLTQYGLIPNFMEMKVERDLAFACFIFAVPCFLVAFMALRIRQKIFRAEKYSEIFKSFPYGVLHAEEVARKTGQNQAETMKEITSLIAGKYLINCMVKPNSISPLIILYEVQKNSLVSSVISWCRTDSRLRENSFCKFQGIHLPFRKECVKRTLQLLNLPRHMDLTNVY